MSARKRVLVFNDYFYPGYRGGGPIQSLLNLIVSFENDFKFYVVTGSSDHHAPNRYEGYAEDIFSEVRLPGATQPISIFYANSADLTRRKIHQIINEVAPASVYLNGIFSTHYLLFPLYVLRTTPVKIVVCPRGMLQKGALSVKPFKKKVYLTYLRLAGLLKKAHWHATNQEEAVDIADQFTSNQGVTIAPNIPRAPLEEIVKPAKHAGELRLVYLSLITEKKNLLFLLQVIGTSEKNIQLDIYGPITDEAYWAHCEELIKKMPDRVAYRGDVQPHNVPHVLAGYHALILLTKGENFGHALYESLSVGRPIITSDFTPWNNLLEHKAGLNVPIDNLLSCLKTIDFFLKMEQHSYDTFCVQAHHLACDYYSRLDIKPYQNLLG